ncbi:hypothetical protein GW755_00545 [bacterium]|nr:hypothetical protein [bacterium]
MILDNVNNLSNVLNVPVYAMVLLGIVPTIATIVSFGRHVLGFKSFSIYVPIITSIVFLDLGLVYGLVVASIVLFTTLITRRLLIKFRMHYFVRISFIYTIVCFLLFGVLVTLSFFSYGELLNFKPLFPVILLVTLVEEYFNSVVKDGENKVMLMFLETLGISTLSYFIISSAFFTSVILNNLWLLLLLFPINIALAGWEGLRFSELSRFKSVILNEMNAIEAEADTKKEKKK